MKKNVLFFAALFLLTSVSAQIVVTSTQAYTYTPPVCHRDTGLFVRGMLAFNFKDKWEPTLGVGYQFNPYIALYATFGRENGHAKYDYWYFGGSYGDNESEVITYYPLCIGGRLYFGNTKVAMYIDGCLGIPLISNEGAVYRHYTEGYWSNEDLFEPDGFKASSYHIGIKIGFAIKSFDFGVQYVWQSVESINKIVKPTSGINAWGLYIGYEFHFGKQKRKK